MVRPPLGLSPPPLPTEYVTVASGTVEQVVDALVQVGGGSEEVVGLCGIGGSGKTTQCLALARDVRVQDAFTDVVWLDVGEDAHKTHRGRSSTTCARASA